MLGIHKSVLHTEWGSGRWAAEVEGVTSQTAYIAPLPTSLSPQNRISKAIGELPYTQEYS